MLFQLWCDKCNSYRNFRIGYKIEEEELRGQNQWGEEKEVDEETTALVREAVENLHKALLTNTQQIPTS